jgi:hypothetical protein
MMTPMAMRKTQIYLPPQELEALHRIARNKRRRVADLVREAIRTTWLRPEPAGPVALCDGELRATSAEHDAAFDEP